MALRFTRASEQYLYSALSVNRVPMTISLWVRRASLAYWCTLAGVGDVDQERQYQCIQTADDQIRSIGWAGGSGYTSTHSGNPGTTNWYHCVVVFVSDSITFYLDNEAQTPGAWTAGSISIDQIRIGASCSSTFYDYADDYIEHVAVWDVALSTDEIADLYNCDVNPLDIQSDHLLTYTPLIDDMTDESGNLTWTAVNMSSPSYSTSGIEYPASSGSSCTLTYNGNGNTSGSVPTDANSPYESGATVTVLGNTGSLAKTNYTFGGWQTTSTGGTHYDANDTFVISNNTTLYADWTATYQYRTINHTNYDPSSYTNAEILKAAAKKVYFEHASTGQDIVGDSTTNSTTGNNYDDSANCGLALLYAENNRYLCDRDSAESANDYTWFSTHTGLQDNNRGNPTPATKISGFVEMSANMRGAIDIAMWKYCWIDVWPETSGYISDGAAAAASDIEDIEAFEAANPSITVVWWTMPLQDDASYAAREAYNSAIRTYCLDHAKWLIDIADIECYNTSNVKQVDGNGREIAETSYMRADGGHLGTDGRLRMGKAYWSLLAAIANENLNPTTYKKEIIFETISSMKKFICIKRAI